MNRLFITLLLVLSAWGTMKAQLYADGDINKDGIVNVSDISTLVDKLLKETAKTPEELIAGKWQAQDGEIIQLNANGTTDYGGATTFKYKANEKYIYMYGSSNEIKKLFSVIDITSAYMRLKALGDTDEKIFYNEFLVANPFIKTEKVIVIERKNYVPAVGDDFEAIDLGLPSKKLWANMNLGANSPEEEGYYYAWGEKTPKYNFTSENYFATAFEDAATAALGEEWCVPSKEDLIELAAYCKYTSTTINGVKGYTYTGTNGNSIFLPNNYVKINNSYCSESNGHGNYLCTTEPDGAGYVVTLTTPTLVSTTYIKTTSIYYYSNAKYAGYNIRPVKSQK